jgi:hypothetical protein
MRSIQQFLVVGVSALVLLACKKEDTAPPLDPIGGGNGGGQTLFDGTLNGHPGVRMTLDGEEVLIVEEGSLIASANADGQTVPAPGISSQYYTSGFYDTDAKEMKVELTIGTLYFQAPGPDPEAFENFLEPGPRNYGPATTGSNGVEIEYRDANGQRWSTQCGAGPQAGSEFQIMESAFGTDGLGYKVKVLCTFSGILYNCVSGASMSVTAGTLVLDIRLF